MSSEGFSVLTLSLIYAIILGLFVFLLSLVLSREKTRAERVKSGIVVTVSVCAMTFLLCVAIGFSYVFQYLPTPITKPLSKDLIGTWTLTEKSQEELLKLGKLASTNQIIIKEDGSCVLIQVPSLIVSSKGYDVNFLSGRGVWSLEQDANEDDLIDLSVILDGGTKSDYIIMFISGNKPPFTLFQNLFGKLPNWTYSRAF